MAEMPPEVRRWGRFIENSVVTSYYRVLSFVSVHAPVSEVYTACKYYSENTPYGGDVYWLVQGRIFNWDNINVNQDSDYPVYMNLRVFGSSLRGKNTVFARVGWFKMYIVDAVLSIIGLPFRSG